MTEKPNVASEYGPELIELTNRTALFLCTKLGDYMEQFVIVGGLVPSLIIPQDPPPEGADGHLGTRDLDIGFSLGILDENRYQEISARLRSAGFAPDRNDRGNPTFQKWRLKDDLGVSIDFLIPQTDPAEEGGSIKNLEEDFAAVITPGLELAFADRIKVHLSGRTVFEENAERDVWVCGPGAYVVLKALAFSLRGENKDAYDLYYVIRNYGDGPGEVAQRLMPLLESREGQQAIEILRTDFGTPDSLGPFRVAQFVEVAPNADLQADASSFVAELLRECDQ